MTRRAFTLVSTLVTLVIILMLAGVLFYGSGLFTGKSASSRKDGLGKTIPGAAMVRAKDEACRSNLDQARKAIQILMINEDDAPPASLAEARLPAELTRCTVGKEPYTYDPQKGEVKCPHPGHEGF